MNHPQLGLAQTHQRESLCSRSAAPSRAANARTVLAGKMAATRRSAGLGDSFLALRHAQAGPGQEHHSTLDRNTTAPKMPRYQSEGQESQYNIRFCFALACCAPFWRVEIAIGGREYSHRLGS